MESRAIVVLLSSTVEDEAERDFVSKCLKSLELSALDKNTFAIVDSKVEHAEGIYPSWQRKTSETGLEFTVPDSDSSSCEEDTFISALNTSQKQLSVQCSLTGGTDLSNAAHVIHQLLDTFPIENTVMAAVDLVWVVPTSQAVEIGHALELYGSLLRLSEWYSGRIDILCQDNTAKFVMDEWRSDLRAGVITGCEVRCSSDVVWRGTLQLQEQLEAVDQKQPPQLLSLDGFSLVGGSDVFSEEVFAQLKQLQEQELIASHLEALQVIEQSAIPLMWISGSKFTLQVDDEAHCPDAASLLREVESWRGRCGVLLALKAVPLSSLREQRGQTKWIEFVKKLNEKTAMSCLRQPPVGQLRLDFVERWLPNRGHSWEEPKSVLNREVSLFKIGSVSQQLYGELESEPGLLFYAVCPEMEDSHDHLQHLPAVDLWLLRSPELLQCSELEGLLSDIPLVEAVDVADAKRDSLSLLYSIPNLSACGQTMVKRHSEVELDNGVFSPFWSQLSKWEQVDAVWSPSVCAELLAMKNKERIDSLKLKRLKTPDITFNNRVIPRPCMDKDSENLTATGILQHFNLDGTPLESVQLSPIPAMSNVDKLCLWTFPESGEETLTTMRPLGTQGFYHGVNYCLGAGEAEDARVVRIQQRCILDDTGGSCTAVNTPRVKEIAKKRNSLRAAAATAKQRGGMKEQAATPVNSSVDRKQQRKKATKEPSASTQPSRTPPPVTAQRREPLKDANGGHCMSISDSCPAKLGPLPRKRGAIPLAESSWSSPPNTRRQQDCPVKPLQSTNRQMSKKKAVTVKSRTEPERQKENDPGHVATGEENVLPVHGERSLVSASSMQTPLGLDSAVDSAQTVAVKRSERHRKKLECIAAKALQRNGLSRDHPCFKQCFRRLYQISKSFLKDLKTTVNLSDEMRQVTEQNAKQVIGFELKMAGTQLDIGQTDQ